MCKSKEVSSELLPILVVSYSMFNINYGTCTHFVTILKHEFFFILRAPIIRGHMILLSEHVMYRYDKNARYTLEN